MRGAKDAFQTCPHSFRANERLTISHSFSQHTNRLGRHLQNRSVRCFPSRSYALRHLKLPLWM